MLSSARRAPVISILSPSPLASRRAQEILNTFFGLEIINGEEHISSLSSTTSNDKSWDSVISRCPSSGALIHCLSKDTGSNDSSGWFGTMTKKETAGTEPFSLLSISDYTPDLNSDSNIYGAISDIRKMLSSNNMKPPSFGSKVLHKLGITKKSTAELYFDQQTQLPILNLSPVSSTEDSEPESPKKPTFVSGLKEIAFVQYDNNNSNESMHSRLANAGLLRRKPGLFQWNTQSGEGGTCIRLLPPAENDHKSIPLVLVFQSDSIVETEKDVSEKILTNNKQTFGEQKRMTIEKIGFKGGTVSLKNNNKVVNSAGQLRLIHEDLNGLLDLRFCGSRKFNAMFNEAQESIYAGSFNELQQRPSVGKNQASTEGEGDADGGDCWKEFRLTLKRPGGYLKQQQTSQHAKIRGVSTPDQ